LNPRQRSGLHRIRKGAADIWPVTRRRLLRLLRTELLAEDLLLRGSEIKLARRRGRIDDTVEAIIARLQVGNVYVNRNMIGAVVGVQPFGGHGLSSTGPKAGGPHYLTRFAIEQTVTINTAAAGGNAALLSGEE
jgi:hypothetical protein